MAVCSKINFHSATKEKIWLSCIRLGRHLDLGRKALIDLENVIWTTAHDQLVGAVLG